MRDRLAAESKAALKSQDKQRLSALVDPGLRRGAENSASRHR